MDTAKTIKELRESVNMNRKEFSEHTGIPVRTLEDWEAGRRTPPEYIPRLIAYQLKYEELVGKEDGGIPFDVRVPRYNKDTIAAINEAKDIMAGKIEAKTYGSAKELFEELDTDTISYIEPVPGATGEWYFGLDHEQGDLFEAEELFRDGHVVKGQKLCLVHYPDGQVFWPVPRMEGHYSERPVFLEGSIYMLDVDFPGAEIRILRFDCADHQTSLHALLPLSSVKDCYNLQLHIAPLMLSRQCGNEFEILWPERISFRMGDHDSFFLRDGERLFFNRWHEEGEGVDYRFWEETIIRDLEGNEIQALPGDVMLMPNGELWHLK